MNINEISLLKESFENNIRIDGRMNTQMREIFIKQGYINNANGSVLL